MVARSTKFADMIHESPNVSSMHYFTMSFHDDAVEVIIENANLPIQVAKEN